MSKKNKHKKYQLAALEAKPTSYNINDKVIQSYLRQPEEYFRWTIVYQEYIPSKSCKSEPFVKFLKHTISSLNEYESKKWDEVLNQKNNHIIKSTQDVKSGQKVKNKLKEINKVVEVYQIKGSCQEHRIFGYRENGIFHVMLNDLHHSETKSNS